MNKQSSAPRIVLIILLVILLGICVGIGVSYLGSGKAPLPRPLQDGAVPTDSTVDTAPTDSPVSPDDNPEGRPGGSQTATTTKPVPLEENPVDFPYYQSINSDIYAWIHVPGTDIRYPVACATDQADGFYLEHNIYREYEFAGTIYSEKKNGFSFSDRNTVLYGHNMLNGTMFAQLHKFEETEFFDKHDVFYIYMPGHIYTYKIFSAYEYDNRHLLNSFDYTNDDVWQEYLENATNPKSMNVNTREVEVKLTDRIVTLSTCVGYNKNARYLVQGVLIHDQPTK